MDKLDIERCNIHLQSNEKVNIGKLVCVHKLYLRSPLCWCIKIMGYVEGRNIRRAKTNVKFNALIRPICRPT